MLLAGDVGGTKTLLGLFSPAPERPSTWAHGVASLVEGRPALIEVGEFTTLEYDGLEPMIVEFLRAWKVEPRHIEAACIGVAGAITSQVARMTNVPWAVDAAAVSERIGIARTRILNDLEALGYAVPVLGADELAPLQRGTPVEGGHAAVIAAGTGLGEAFLHNIDGRLVPSASEGGHADFAARTPRELEMVRALTPIFGRVSAETVISGPGLVNIYQFTHDAFGTGPLITPSSLMPARLCTAVGPVDDVAALPARISRAAAEGRCPKCVEAFEMFVAAYGAEAGNIALRGVATAGVYVGGGIAPKILPALQSGGFLDAFRAKEPMADLVSAIPVAVILNDDAGLLGAAVYAQESLLRR
jgi:glucokinase